MIFWYQHIFALYDPFLFILSGFVGCGLPAVSRFRSMEGLCCHFLFSCFSFSHIAHAPRLPVRWREIQLLVYHATHFHTLLTILHFRYVNARYDFYCVDSSTTVDESWRFGCIGHEGFSLSTLSLFCCLQFPKEFYKRKFVVKYRLLDPIYMFTSEYIISLPNPEHWIQKNTFMKTSRK